MSSQTHGNFTRRPATHANTLADLSPFSTLACQVEATNTWRRDLKSLFGKASDRFADVCWTPTEDGDEGMTNGDRKVSAWGKSSPVKEGVIWAHKAILYARAPNTFQARFLLLQAPAANLGSMASGSAVSLPSLRVPSPSLSSASRTSSTAHSTKRRTTRGAAPPSSFSMNRTNSKNSTHASNSDGETENLTRPGLLKRNSSNSSMGSSYISRPMSRDGRRLSQQTSYDSLQYTSTPSLGTESDALSVISTTSTVKAPMSLDGVNRVFFEATLQYLYTAEESMKEAFEFLYEDRIAADEGPEERLEKLRQDLVFMWRSRLYSDVEIVLGDEDERTTVRSIPDINASVTSFNLPDAAEEDDETASFSAHRMMLASRSPYFAAQLLSPYSDANARVIRLPSPPFTPAALHFTLGFIYTGTLFFSNRTFDLSTAFQLWRSASYLQIDTLSSLVSSLIIQDFCHGFTCSPPCKTCVKRVPRTLAFVSCPDVNDAHLQGLARNAVSGDDFGHYWSKEVGNLDYAIRGALVSDLCSRIDARPGYAIYALRQLSMIGTRIDTERSHRWVDAVRWMCESVESHICVIMETKLPEVVQSREWNGLVDGVGFLNDILEKCLSIIVDGLTEKRAAKVYEVVVGQVLLREDGLPSNDLVVMVEKARRAIIFYLRKRWVNIRANAGFNDIESWALKELADEIDVPSSDLLLSARSKSITVPPRSKIATKAGGVAVASVPHIVAENSARSGQVSAAPGQALHGEREAGPIHLRAAILNRNAARTFVVSGNRSTDQVRSNSSPSPSAREGSYMMNRPRHSTGRASNDADSIDTDTARASTSNTAARSSLQRQATTLPSHTDASVTSTISPPSVRRKASASSSSQRVAVVSSSSTNIPPVSLRSVASSSASQVEEEQIPRKGVSPSVAAFRSKIQQESRSSQTSTPDQVPAIPQSRVAGQVKKRTSEASLPKPSLLTQSPSAASTSRTLRIRQKSASSIASTSNASLRKVETSASTAAIASKTLRKESYSRLAQKRKEEEHPPMPVRLSTVLRDSSSNSRAMQFDDDDEEAKRHPPALSTSLGTQLSNGIPCVIAPKNTLGKAVRFRAVVKYIGPVLGQDVSPYVGVEVSLPLPAGVDEGGYDFHDGIYKGVKYYDCGLPLRTNKPRHELSHKPEREARRLRIEQMMQGRPWTEAADHGHEGARASAKRRKDLFGASTLDQASSSSSRGLFIRPNEVLWVVV
ncbi:hypothetical protein CBS101457_001505 [Exobasidium rhododendri]|nr:hypothetical protein CBS101457_001505 [Exobasidium rhododendri]